MNSLPNNRDNRAATLKDAQNACDLVPLINNSRYYVDLSRVRDSKGINGINLRLEDLDPGNFNATLFTGHRGCGKSTELRRIQDKWKSQYQIIYIDAAEEIDITDAQYTDLYLAIIKRVEEELRKSHLKFSSTPLKNFESWFKEITHETEDSVDKSLKEDFGVELTPEVPFIGKLVAKFLLELRSFSQKKVKTRIILDKTAAQLTGKINELLQDASTKFIKKFPGCKGCLVIFDSLDRVPPKVGEHLFFDYAAQLKELACTVIYTVPISALYLGKNMTVDFDSPYVMPMVEIYNFDQNSCNLDYNEKGLEAMESLIEHRVEIEKVFESRQDLLVLAKASGGHVRQLMSLMKTACENARSSNHEKITKEDVDDTIEEKRGDFQRLIINDESYSLLAKVYITRELPRDKAAQDMLYHLCILEYGKNTRWHYVNPLIMNIPAFKRALQSAKKEL